MAILCSSSLTLAVSGYDSMTCPGADKAAPHLPVKPSLPSGRWGEGTTHSPPVRSTTYRKLMLDGLNKDAYLRPITRQGAALNDNR
jgi:hypothetical protein